MTNTILVVGAGPTGLALACGLRLHGLPVRFVDHAAGPATTSRALGLQPRGVEVLSRLDALGDLPTHSLPVRQIVVHVGGRELGRLAVGRPTPLVRRPGLLVSQAEIEDRLRRRLADLGCEPQWSTAPLSVNGGDRGDPGVEVELSDGERLRAAWVVGCDGAHSAVRKAAGIGFPGVPLVERFLLADVHATLPLARDTVAVWLDGDDLVAAFPLPGEDRWRLMAPAETGTGELDADAVLTQLTTRLALRSGLPATTVGEAHWTSVFRFHRRLADTYRAGRVLLAGDAAHIHSPFGGQGLNTGIGDAENLAWKLALVHAGRADPALLDTYEAERRPIAHEVLASTSGLTRLVMGGSATARRVRDHVLVPLMNRGAVQRLIWERASQLSISYRGGPLARGGPARRPWRPVAVRPRPGDRVPDLPCRTTDLTTTTLHTALRGEWAVVATDPALRGACATTAREFLGDDAVVALAPRSGEGDALFVRPDAHLAWRGRDPAGLRRWLVEALHPDGRGVR